MKNTILIISVLFCFQVNAQFIIWQDNFTGGADPDWVFVDVDGNSSNWAVGKNLQYNSLTNVYSQGEIDVLATYNINLNTGAPLANNENNWAIMPVQNLSGYSGTIWLRINAQTSVYGGNQDFRVYVSNSPAISSFLQTPPAIANLTRISNEGEEFQQKIIDLSAYAGQPQLYIAIMKGPPSFVGIEINDIKLTANDIAGVDDFVRNDITIKQNPVAETLQFFGDLSSEGIANVSIYNLSGQLVKEAPYNSDGIAVSELADGMYLVVLNNGGATKYLKFIKK